LLSLLSFFVIRRNLLHRKSVNEAIWLDHLAHYVPTDFIYGSSKNKNDYTRNPHYRDYLDNVSTADDDDAQQKKKGGKKQHPFATFSASSSVSTSSASSTSSYSIHKMVNKYAPTASASAATSAFLRNSNGYDSNHGERDSDFDSGVDGGDLSIALSEAEGEGEGDEYDDNQGRNALPLCCPYIIDGDSGGGALFSLRLGSLEYRSFFLHGLGGLYRLMTACDGYSTAARASFVLHCERKDPLVLGKLALFKAHCFRLRTCENAEIFRELLQHIAQKHVSKTLTKTSEVAKMFRKLTPEHKLKSLETFLKYGGEVVEVDVFDEVLFHSFQRLVPEFRRFLYSFQRIRPVTVPVPVAVVASPTASSAHTTTAAKKDTTAGNGSFSGNSSAATAAITSTPANPSTTSSTNGNSSEYRRSILMEYVVDIAIEALHINSVNIQRVFRGFLGRRMVNEYHHKRRAVLTEEL
jgi:hypothetical protein